MPNFFFCHLSAHFSTDSEFSYIFSFAHCHSQNICQGIVTDDSHIYPYALGGSAHRRDLAFPIIFNQEAPCASAQSLSCLYLFHHALLEQSLPHNIFECLDHSRSLPVVSYPIVRLPFLSLSHNNYSLCRPPDPSDSL